MNRKHASSESGILTGRVIGAAIAVASLLLVGGLVLFLRGGGATYPLRGNGIVNVLERAGYGIVHLEPRGLIQAGLLVLLLAPLARLLAGVVRNARARDWRFVLIGLMVASLLLAGILLGTR